MRTLVVALVALLLEVSALPALEPPIAPELLKKQWPASWIAAADGPERDAGVFHFRKTLRLDAAPVHFVVHVSADNRYLLRVNGRRVGTGPARSDLLHWAYESYDLAPYLRAGDNLVAATVWNFGTLSPMAQMSRRTGFLVQGDDEASGALDTGRGWEAAFDPGHAPNPDSLEASGLGNEYVGLLHPWRELLAQGLTTWPEHPEPSRSDCHAWSAHPAFDLLRIVAGIAPSAPGFRVVKIEPHLGVLRRVLAAMPTPRGEIAVVYRRDGDRLQAQVALPDGLSGTLVWRGRATALHAGQQQLELP